MTREAYPVSHWLSQGHALLRRLRAHGLAIGILLLAALTVYYAYDLPRKDWRGLADAAAAKWPLLLIALAINALGVACDYVAWRCAWRGQGVRFPKGHGFPYFVSVFALQLTPLQVGRFARVAFAFRAGIASLRAGATAESLILFMDAFSLGIAIVALLLPVAWWPLSMAAVLLAGPTVLLMADAFRKPLEKRFPKYFEHPLFSIWNLGAYFGRMIDWFCVATILYLIADVTGAGVPWRAAAVSALGASFIASASALPGGLGASEAALAVGLHVYADAAAKLNAGITVLGYRVLTFWMWLPLGWWGLLRVRKLTQRAAEARARAAGGTHA